MSQVLSPFGVENNDECRREREGGFQRGRDATLWPARTVVRQTVCWPTGGTRQAVPRSSSTQNEVSVKSTPVQPEVATTNEVEDQVRGGDRRIARRKSRESRVTVRFDEREHVQLTRVKNRYGLSESGAIRAAVDYLDGAPAPKLVNRDLLRLIGEVNAVGVNVNQIARQGWAGIEPDVDDLRRATATFLALAKELSR